MLASLNLNTHRIVKHLESKGFTEEQAEGFIEAIEEIDLIGVATKEDLTHLATKKDLEDLRVLTQRDIKDVKVNLETVKANIGDLRKELSDTRVDLMKFMLLQTIAIIGVTFGLVKFL